MLHLIGRIVLTIIVPLYLGYLGASLNIFDIYLVLAAAWSLWAYGQPGPQLLWDTGGPIGVLKGWLVMAIAVLFLAAPAYGVGYLIARTQT